MRGMSKSRSEYGAALVGFLFLAAGILVSHEALAGGSSPLLSPGMESFVRSAAPVRACVDPDWPPYEVLDAQGRHVGIAADLLRLAASRVGLTVEIVRTKDWDETLAASKEGRCQIVSFLNRSSDREAWLDFTRPIFTDPNAIITREEHPFIADLASLPGATVVLPRGTSIEERLRRDFPALKVVTTDSEADAFAAVAARDADMTVRSMTVAVYTIKQRGWFNLKVAGKIPGYDNELRIGVLKNEQMLKEILDIGVASITPEERAEIANRHVGIIVQTGIDYGMLRDLAILLIVVITTSLFWIFKLKRLNARLSAMSRTDSLTGLPNRLQLSHAIAEAVARAATRPQDQAVLLLDIDHFKAVNDRYGHLAGDEVLKGVGRILRTFSGPRCTVGRWGGEEFMFVCLDTKLDDVNAIANKVVMDVRSQDFEECCSITISVGLATGLSGDTAETLVQRADNALYMAKQAGRDCMKAA